MGLQTFFMAKGRACYCGAVSRTARGKITVSGIPNCLNYRDVFILYTPFTKVAAGYMRPMGRGLEIHDLNVLCDSVI